MRNGEGFLLVFSVIDRSRFVNAEFFGGFFKFNNNTILICIFYNFFYSSHVLAHFQTPIRELN